MQQLEEVEAAKRALMRREEDLAWMRIQQRYHSDRGAVLRQQQRRLAAALEQQEREAREAQTKLEIAGKLEQQAEVAEDERRAVAAREADSIVHRERLEAARAKRQREAQEKERREAQLRRRAAAREEADNRRRREEAAERRRVGEKLHLSRGEYNKAHPRTPHPKTICSLPAPTRRSASATPAGGDVERSPTKPDTAPVRASSPGATSAGTSASHAAEERARVRATIATQAELDAADAKARAAERTRLEVSRLQNLLLRKRQISHERESAEKEREWLEELSRQRQEAVEVQRFEEQRRHVETVRSLQRPAGASALQRTMSSTNGSRSGSPPIHDEEQYRLEIKARQEEEAALRKKKREEEDRLISEKTAKNLDHLRRLAEERKEEQRAEYEVRLEMARQHREREERIAQLVVEQIREERREQEESVVKQREQHRRRCAMSALEQKLAAERAAQVIAEQQQEEYDARHAEKHRLRFDTRQARRRMRRLAEQERLKEAEVEANQQKLREETLRLEVEAKNQRRAESERLTRKKQLDAMLDRQRKREEIERIREANDAFYDLKVKAQEDKPRPDPATSPAAEASAPVTIPPHPELVDVERQTKQTAAHEGNDLARADRQMRRLTNDRL